MAGYFWYQTVVPWSSLLELHQYISLYWRIPTTPPDKQIPYSILPHCLSYFWWKMCTNLWSLFLHLQNCVQACMDNEYSHWLVPSLYHKRSVWLNKETNMVLLIDILYNSESYWKWKREDLVLNLQLIGHRIMHNVMYSQNGGITQRAYIRKYSHSLLFESFNVWCHLMSHTLRIIGDSMSGVVCRINRNSHKKEMELFVSTSYIDC